MKHTGIVLRIVQPERCRLIVWDSLHGKIELRWRGQKAVRAIQGSLITYELHHERDRWYIKECALDAIPAPWVNTDILFLHKFLDIAQRLLAWHDHDANLFSWALFLYGSEPTHTDFFKKWAIAHLLYRTGMYAELPFEEYTFLDLISQAANTTLELPHDYKFEQELDRWIYQCIQFLP